MKREDAEEWTQAAAQTLTGQFRQIDLAIKLGVPKALEMDPKAWVQEKLGGYMRYTIEERRAAHKELAAEGKTQREIADRTGVDQKTVSNDLRSGEENSSKPKRKPKVSEPASAAPEENSSPGNDLEIVDAEIVDEPSAPEPEFAKAAEHAARNEDARSSKRIPAQAAATFTKLNRLIDDELSGVQPFPTPYAEMFLQRVKALGEKGWFNESER